MISLNKISKSFLTNKKLSVFKDLNYNLEVDELPEIKIQSLESIKFTDYEIKITEEEKKKG